MTLGISSNVSSNLISSSSSASMPNISNIQLSSSSLASQQHQSTSATLANHFSSVVSPPVMPPFNFNMQDNQRHYFHPVPPSFTNSQKQQTSFQFNPNAVNTFPTSAEQTLYRSPYTNNNHSRLYGHENVEYSYSHNY